MATDRRGYMREEIKLREPFGVSAAVESSRLLATAAGKLGKKNVLDLGTGSGYVGIYLAKQGATVTAVDVSPIAVEVATGNAKENNVSIAIFQSDLFEKVRDLFDLIIWNAPVGDAAGSRIVDVVKSVIRKLPLVYKFAQSMTYKLFLKERTGLDKKVAKEAYQYLQNDGILLLLIIDGEEEALVPFALSLGYKREDLDSSALRRTIKGSFLLLKKQNV
ncbi:MAG TPA: methyltransferase [Candidatus Paceibacterota bacterium]